MSNQIEEIKDERIFHLYKVTQKTKLSFYYSFYGFEELEKWIEKIQDENKCTVDLNIFPDNSVKVIVKFSTYTLTFISIFGDRL